MTRHVTYSDGGETRTDIVSKTRIRLQAKVNLLIPSPDDTLVNELGKFSLRQQGANEVHASKIPDLDMAKLERV